MSPKVRKTKDKGLDRVTASGSVGHKNRKSAHLKSSKSVDKNLSKSTASRTRKPLHSKFDIEWERGRRESVELKLKEHVVKLENVSKSKDILESENKALSSLIRNQNEILLEKDGYISSLKGQIEELLLGSLPEEYRLSLKYTKEELEKAKLSMAEKDKRIKKLETERSNDASLISILRSCQLRKEIMSSDDEDAEGANVTEDLPAKDVDSDLLLSHSSAEPNVVVEHKSTSTDPLDIPSPVKEHKSTFTDPLDIPSPVKENKYTSTVPLDTPSPVKEISSLRRSVLKWKQKFKLGESSLKNFINYRNSVLQICNQKKTFTSIEILKIRPPSSSLLFQDICTSDSFMANGNLPQWIKSGIHDAKLEINKKIIPKNGEWVFEKSVSDLLDNNRNLVLNNLSSKLSSFSSTLEEHLDNKQKKLDSKFARISDFRNCSVSTKNNVASEMDCASYALNDEISSVVNKFQRKWIKDKKKNIIKGEKIPVRVSER